MHRGIGPGTFSRMPRRRVTPSTERGATQVSVLLDPGKESVRLRDPAGDLLPRIDEMAKSMGINRSALIRIFCEQALGTPLKIAVVRETVIEVHTRLKPIIGKIIRDMSDNLADELVRQYMDEDHPEAPLAPDPQRPVVPSYNGNGQA